MKHKNISEYISFFPKDTAKRLEIIRKIIRKSAPGATEAISYNIPTFKLDGKYLIYFAGYKHHVGLYPYSRAMGLNQKEIAQYRKGKGTLQFPLEEKLPVTFITKVIKNLVKAKRGKKK